MTPLILNLDSAYDWTEEVRAIWEQLDWLGLRNAVAPQIPVQQWLNRREELGCIGLVSGLYAGVAPKVTGLGGILGLEKVAQQWSGESAAEAPIYVTQDLLTKRMALVPLAA